MLEHVPEWLGRALTRVRAGADKLVIAQQELGQQLAPIQLSSTAFPDGGRIPLRFTADGEGVSPPLLWTGIPDGAQSLALIVEDPDAPTPQPLVHAVVWGMPPGNGGLGEGAIVADGGGDDEGSDVGRNSYFFDGWVPPDPPTGHGEHRYAFQLFALAGRPALSGSPGRSSVAKAMRGQVLAVGLLTGTYSRGDPAKVGPAAAAVRAR